MRNIIAVLLSFMFLFSRSSEAKEFEAVIKFFNGNTTHITIEAKDYFTAKDQIIARYCMGDNACLIEGPWSVAR